MRDLNDDISKYNIFMERASRLDGILRNLRPDARTIHNISRLSQHLQHIRRGLLIDKLDQAEGVLKETSSYLETYFKDYSRRRTK